MQRGTSEFWPTSDTSMPLNSFNADALSSGCLYGSSTPLLRGSSSSQLCSVKLHPLLRVLLLDWKKTGNDIINPNYYLLRLADMGSEDGGWWTTDHLLAGWDGWKLRHTLGPRWLVLSTAVIWADLLMFGTFCACHLYYEELIWWGTSLLSHPSDWQPEASSSWAWFRRPLAFGLGWTYFLAHYLMWWIWVYRCLKSQIKMPSLARYINVFWGGYPIY